MHPWTRVFSIIALVFVPALSLLGQSAAAPSGHWTGAIQLPNMDLRIEIDLAKSSKGDFAGTFAQPDQGVKGLPLAAVAVDGQSVLFVVKADGEMSTFNGQVADDGQSIAGNVVYSEYSFPFRLSWAGEARMTPVPKSAAIGKQLEGTWNGTLDAGGRKQRLVLRMANQTDGTATGTIVSLDGSGVQIPIAITQKASTLTVEVPSIGISYVGVLNAEGTELSGTWTQGTFSVPLSFQRAAK